MGVKIRERPKGSGIWCLFIDHNGVRKFKKIGRDKKFAQKIAKEIEAKLVLGDLGILNGQDNEIPTLKEYLKGWDDSEGQHEGWLTTFAQLALKNSTRHGYQHIIANHLLPEFGEKRLDEINSRMIGAFIFSLFGKELKNQKTKAMKNGLKSGTVKNVKNCLSAIMRKAKQDGYIETNPARGIDIPVPEDERPSRDPMPFPWDERDHFEEAVRKYFPAYYPLIVCGFRSGLRIGELIALQWQDLDFYNRLISVERNVTRGKVTTPKTKSSKRQVRMTSQLCDILKAHRTHLKAEKLRRKWEEVTEWVFPNEDGRFLNYGNFVNRIWNKAMEKSGLQRRTPHDMRHTYATLRLSKGDSLAEVSKEMGHGSPDITFRTYYKWLPKESRSNIDELDGNDLIETQPSATYPQPNKKGLTPFSVKPL